MKDFPIRIRPRRNRKSAAIRALVTENRLHPTNLIYPIFVHDKKTSEPIASMPNQQRLSIADAVKIAERARKAGIRGLALFPALHESLKDPRATEGKNRQGLLARALSEIKRKVPELVLFSDVAMDPYSSDGHDGLLVGDEIQNDATLEILAEMALTQAHAGADFIAPSDMMDGRVGYLRRRLDEAGYENVGILAYSAKYASHFYGPFRDALESAPKKGDKKSYQMNPCNAREAVLEALLDQKEGADILMVKPAGLYLDIIARIKAKTLLPLAAYQVSGEYSCLHAAAAQGWLNLPKAAVESMTAIHRAGADMLLSYFALEFAEKWFSQSES